MIDVRAYQQSLIDETRLLMAKGNKRVVKQAPTGAGKTRMSGWVIESAVNKGKKALFLVSGRTLVKQAYDSFIDLGIDAALLMAGNPYETEKPVQVASVHTVFKRLAYLDWLDPQLLVVDECHESYGPMWQAIRQRWPEAYEVGLSATPKPGETYTAMACGPSYGELIEQGHLVKPRYYSVKESDSELLKTAGGADDFTEKSQHAAFERVTLVGGVVKHWQRFAEGRPTVLFAPSVATSRRNAEMFNAAGISAFHIDADTEQEDRQAAFRAIEDGSLQVLCNYAVISRGFDCPAISCVIYQRETKLLSAWIQAVGRGLRAYPGKKDCIVIDLGMNIHRHGCFVEDPVNWEIVGKDPQQERELVREAQPVKDVTCRECHFVYKAAAKCPECGYKPEPKLKEADDNFRDAELSEVKPGKKRTYTREEKQAWYSQLRAVQRERGYKEGWIYQTYKAKFGCRPQGLYEYSLPPSDEVLRFVKYGLIRHARGRRPQQVSAHD